MRFPRFTCVATIETRPEPGRAHYQGVDRWQWWLLQVEPWRPTHGDDARARALYDELSNAWMWRAAAPGWLLATTDERIAVEYLARCRELSAHPSRLVVCRSWVDEPDEPEPGWIAKLRQRGQRVGIDVCYTTGYFSFIHSLQDWTDIYQFAEANLLGASGIPVGLTGTPVGPRRSLSA